MQDQIKFVRKKDNLWLSPSALAMCTYVYIHVQSVLCVCQTTESCDWQKRCLSLTSVTISSSTMCMQRERAVCAMLRARVRPCPRCMDSCEYKPLSLGPLIVKSTLSEKIWHILQDHQPLLYDYEYQGLKWGGGLWCSSQRPALEYVRTIYFHSHC